MHLYDIIKMASSFLDKTATLSYLWKTFVLRSYTSYFKRRALVRSLFDDGNGDTTGFYQQLRFCFSD